jgi:hypothetical protein
VVNPPPTLLMTGTVWPVEQQARKTWIMLGYFVNVSWFLYLTTFWSSLEKDKIQYSGYVLKWLF